MNSAVIQILPQNLASKVVTCVITLNPLKRNLMEIRGETGNMKDSSQVTAQ